MVAIVVLLSSDRRENGVNRLAIVLLRPNKNLLFHQTRFRRSYLRLYGPPQFKGATTPQGYCLSS